MMPGYPHFRKLPYEENGGLPQNEGLERWEIYTWGIFLG
jgi:hypothetical protein